MKIRPLKSAALVCGYVFIFHSFNAAAGAQEDLPSEITSAIESAQELCGAHSFSFNQEYLQQADFNEDGQLDYVLSDQAFDCKGMALYGGSAGFSHTVFLSGESGGLSNSLNLLAYGYEIDRTTSPPQIAFQMRCVMQGTATGTSRYQWQNGEMKLVSSTLNCPKPDDK